MNKMSEDGAIRTAKNFIDYFNKNKCDGNKANLCVLGEEINAIETILDLYNKTKEDNKLYKLCMIQDQDFRDRLIEILGVGDNEETILAELEKKDKIIELMIKHLCDVIDNDSDASLLPFYDSDDNLEAKVKKYFERKAEDVRR